MVRRRRRGLCSPASLSSRQRAPSLTVDYGCGTSESRNGGGAVPPLGSGCPWTTTEVARDASENKHRGRSGRRYARARCGRSVGVDNESASRRPPLRDGRARDGQSPGQLGKGLLDVRHPDRQGAHSRVDPHRAERRDAARAGDALHKDGLREGSGDDSRASAGQARGLLGLGGHEGASRRGPGGTVRRHGEHVARADLPTEDHTPQAPRENVGARRLGRAGFLGIVGAGVGTLFFGKQISSVTSLATKPFADASGLSRIVPSGGWRIYTVADTMPVFNPVSYRLKLDGLVGRPLELSYQELLALPKAEQVSTFHCVTGWIVDGVHWGGVRFH